jgi:hypothetical protein
MPSSDHYDQRGAPPFDFVHQLFASTRVMTPRSPRNARLLHDFFTLSPTCKALDTNMGEKKKRESDNLHRPVHMGTETESRVDPPAKAQSLRTPLTTGGFVKRSQASGCPYGLVIEPLGEPSQERHSHLVRWGGQRPHFGSVGPTD